MLKSAQVLVLSARLSRNGQAITYKAQANTLYSVSSTTPIVSDVKCVLEISAHSDTSNLHKSTSMSLDFCLQQSASRKACQHSMA